MNDLSVVIVNLNNKRLLEECLTSVIKNSQNISFEIIVIDNGSSDGSQEMLKTRFPSIKLIANQENFGFAKANNQGLAVASGRLLLLLNNDTIVKDKALDKMIEFLDRHPNVGACGPRLLNVDGTIQHQGGLFGKRFWLSKQPVAVDFVIGAALMVNKQVIDKIGLMDENLFFYNDDLDWCLRIRKAGWKIYFLPEAEITHYRGYSSKGIFNKKIFVEGFKGGLYFCRKHYGELVFHAYRCLLCLILCLTLPLQLFNPEKLKAYLAIISLSARGQIPAPVLK
ncbi:hypothetical protein A3H38_03150 [candidate division WOR-1 bacterium RIFCSPLOWO2_02_FULL_46_20]|uniref:Glycosyltransferase 2-like domain-containing protein n=2 Tax=Saganbacteria TaxID=1703751 RepID=A0A1F4RC10_UNCSA|nr:MAG: hypothetical protein A3J44_02065 [candidate division WOR-1 bacterium RIFCSPHIGHO2_02_FULL_45_12]OGC05712.1 MAG: hypothetical protein A3H38_03150 [candidate division WOR-1 bacterium RIFCSPLOWO2_02_FULL_46_20]OGC08753.1 MAG: hypothetical protein A3F86_05245 [candidate division WOR-1 bacterium RIFCSPLOWO2_12_FULL_45_9]